MNLQFWEQVLYLMPYIIPVITGLFIGNHQLKKKRKQSGKEIAPEVPSLEDGADVEDDDLVIIEELPQDSVVTPPALPTPPGTSGPAHQQRYLHCIDNGHDRLQAGKRSPKDKDGVRLLEYEFNQDVVQRIAVRLDEEGVAYYIVVPDTTVRTHTGPRARRANNVPSQLEKLYHSIHANAGPAESLDDYTDTDIGGIEVWHAYGSRRGRAMATITLKHLAAVPLIVSMRIRNRGLRSKQAGQFTVLVDTEMPAELTEAPFYNNYIELQLLKDDTFRQQWAEAHVQAFLEMEETGV